MIQSLTAHWPNYFIEGALLGLFMISACLSVAVVEHERSPVRRLVASAFKRRAMIGALMGAIAVALIYSPWGQRSGAHMNPATTIAFWALGKVESVDAVCYCLAQFIGGALGVALCVAAMPQVIRRPPVNCVETIPADAGRRGLAIAFTAEAAMAFVLFLVVLVFANNLSLARFTGLAAGALVALYITFEAPLSGMSINPARTFASAVNTGRFPALWLYLTAPPLGMLAAALTYVSIEGRTSVYCAKLDHGDQAPCIFRCRIHDLRTPANPAPSGGIQQLEPQSSPTAD